MFSRPLLLLVYGVHHLIRLYLLLDQLVIQIIRLTKVLIRQPICLQLLDASKGPVKVFQLLCPVLFVLKPQLLADALVLSTHLPHILGSLVLGDNLILYTLLVGVIVLLCTCLVYFNPVETPRGGRRRLVDQCLFIQHLAVNFIVQRNPLLHGTIMD